VVTDDHYRSRLYDAYSSTHAGVSADSDSGHAFRRDILPHLPPNQGSRVVDLGCGQGQLVRHLHAHGYARASGIDVSREQVDLAHAAGIARVSQGDFRTALAPDSIDVATATDLFEHLSKPEALEAMDSIHTALAPGGRVIMRVPNGVSPFVGNFQHSDLTHETIYTARSLRQLGAAAGFDTVRVHSCPPVAHGWKSGLRACTWKGASGLMKLMLAAETGALRGHHVTQNIVAVFRKSQG
jgi:2-polyprenyl-3-methyl-5-hydroxy-6-metoxy-1,4-benzoquinol methylase